MTTDSSVAPTPAYDNNEHAFVYIIVVLMFYSIGIIIAIVSYINKEKQDAEEEKAYERYYQFKNESGNHKRFYRVQRTIKHLSAIAPNKSDCSSASSETSSSSGSSINFDSACYHDDTDSCSRTSQAKGRKVSSGHTNMESRGEASLVNRDVYDDDVNTSITPCRKDSSNDDRNGRSVSIALTETPSLESAVETFVDDDPSV